MPNIICGISGFRSGVNEISALLGCCATLIRGKHIGPTFKGPETSITTNQRHVTSQTAKILNITFQHCTLHNIKATQDALQVTPIL